MNQKTYRVGGMTCSACSARVEKTVAKLNGVQSASVNLLTERLSVSFDETALDEQAVITTVESLGYSITPFQSVPAPKQSSTSVASGQAQTASSKLKTRLIVSAIFTIPLFYLSMGDMLAFPLPFFFKGAENALIYAFTLFLLCAPVIIVNYPYFFNGFKNLVRRAPNMDSLIAVGSGAAFLYGIYAIYRIGIGMGHGDAETVHRFMMNLYFESAAVILTLITLGKFLEARAKRKTSSAIEKLFSLAPNTAIVERDGVETEILTTEIIAGDCLVVKAGAAIAADGIVISGYGSVDESALTGESLPVDKLPESRVTGGTVNQSGYFKMKATAVGGDTQLAKIIRLVEDATASKAPIAKLADRISGVFVPVVLGIALIAAVIWAALGYGFEFALTAGISVLVISCPCALGLATPTAIMVGTGEGAKNGILIKSAASLESLHRIGIVVLDKTGTVTEGKPAIVRIAAVAHRSEHELLAAAGSLESLSSHPLAVPITAAAQARGMVLDEVSDFEILAGQGVRGVIGGAEVFGGNRKLMETAGVDAAYFKHIEQEAAEKGHTPLFFSRGAEYLGAIILADSVKPTSRAAIAELRRMGLTVVMLTGDNRRTAQTIAAEVGVDKVLAEVLPQEKEAQVRALQEDGYRVAMVGDGINDAPALARADVGIAIGAGTDIAAESADVVLMKSDLTDVAAAIKLSRAVMRNIRQNLFWAFVYNMVGIPLAAGALYALTGWLLSPMIAAAAMSLSSVSVILNALRLKLVQLYKRKRQMRGLSAKGTTNMEQSANTEKTIRIDGMSCMHCANAVEKTLGAIPGVQKAAVNLNEKTATLITDGTVKDDVLRSAIERAGYTVVSIN